MYRINVANVMSKWIGETEMNTAAIFQRAKATQAIMLFDEADSLFAKRTEVTTANDRFANQEVNLLLQEVERYDGIVVLTTNLFGGLDDALERRIQYRVTFPKPITMAHFVAACRRESESSGMLFRETVPSGEEPPEPTIEQLEKLARAQAEWNAEAARIYGMGAMATGPAAAKHRARAPRGRARR